MAELVDAPASGAGVRMDVEVRVLFWAPSLIESPYFVVYRSGFGCLVVPNNSQISYQIDGAASATNQVSIGPKIVMISEDFL